MGVGDLASAESGENALKGFDWANAHPNTPVLARALT
jgi:hypothetical protein